MFKKLYEVSEQTLSNPWALLIISISLIANTSIVYMAMPSWIGQMNWNDIYIESGSGFAAAVIFWRSIIGAFLITLFVTMLEVMVIGLILGIVGAQFSMSRFIKPVTTIAMGTGIFWVHLEWVKLITTSINLVVAANGLAPNPEVVNRLMTILTLGQAIACLFIGVPLDLLFNSITAHFVVRTAKKKEDVAIELLEAEAQIMVTTILNGQKPQPLLGNLAQMLGIGSEVSLLTPSIQKQDDLASRFPALRPVVKDLRFIPGRKGQGPKWFLDVDDTGYGRTSHQWLGLGPGETRVIDAAPTSSPAPSSSSPRTGWVTCKKCGQRIRVVEGVAQVKCACGQNYTLIPKS